MKYIGVKFLRFASILQNLFIYEYESHPFDTQGKYDVTPRTVDEVLFSMCQEFCFVKQNQNSGCEFVF